MNTNIESNKSTSRDAKAPKALKQSKGKVSRTDPVDVSSDTSYSNWRLKYDTSKGSDQESPEVTQVSSCRYMVEREIANEMCPPDGALSGMLRVQNNLVELERRVVQRPQLHQVKTDKTEGDPGSLKCTATDEETDDDLCTSQKVNTSTQVCIRSVTFDIFDADNASEASGRQQTTAMVTPKSVTESITPVLAASQERQEVDTEEDKSDRKCTSSPLYDSTCAQLVRLYSEKCRAHYDRHANQSRFLREAYADIDARSSAADCEPGTLEDYNFEPDVLHARSAQRMKLYSPLGPRGLEKQPRTKSQKKDSDSASVKVAPVRQVRSAGSSSPPRQVISRRKPDAYASTSPEPRVNGRPRHSKVTLPDGVSHHAKPQSTPKTSPTDKLPAAPPDKIRNTECWETGDAVKNTTADSNANQSDIMMKGSTSSDAYVAVPHITDKRLTTASSPRPGVLEPRPISAFLYPLAMADDCSPDTRKLATYLESRREKILTDPLILGPRSPSEPPAVRQMRATAISPSATEVCYDVSVTTTPRADTAPPAVACNVSIVSNTVKKVSASCTGDIVSKSLQQLTSRPLVCTSHTVEKLLGRLTKNNRFAKVGVIKFPQTDFKAHETTPKLHSLTKKSGLLTVASELTFRRRQTQVDVQQEPVFVPVKTQLAPTETTILHAPDLQCGPRPRSRPRRQTKHIQILPGTPRSRSRRQKTKRSKNISDALKQPSISVLKLVTREDPTTYSPVPQLVPERLVRSSPIGHTTPVQMIDGKFGVFLKTPDCPPPPPNSPCAIAAADGETTIDDNDFCLVQSGNVGGGEDVNVSHAERTTGTERRSKARAAELRCARVEFRWMDESRGSRTMLDSRKKARRTVTCEISSRFRGSTFCHP